jgi:hypothetical protein
MKQRLITIYAIVIGLAVVLAPLAEAGSRVP